MQLFYENRIGIFFGKTKILFTNANKLKDISRPMQIRPNKYLCIILPWSGGDTDAGTPLSPPCFLGLQAA